MRRLDYRLILLLTALPLTSPTTARPSTLGPQDFEDPVVLSPRLGTLTGVAAGDFDGDADIDVVALALDGTLWCFERYGLDWYRPARVLQSFSSGGDLLKVDLDADGDLDLVVSDPVSAGIIGLRNGGDWDFSNSVALSNSAVGVSDVCAADVNGDSLVDIAYATPGTGQVQVALNLGTGNFQTLAVGAGFGNPVSIDAFDLGADGDGDLLVLDDVNNSITWLENDGALSFSSVNVSSFAANAQSVLAGDFDVDGDPDVVYSSLTQGVVAHENLGAAGFGAPIVISSSIYPSALWKADLDSDGLPDLGCGDSAIRVFPNTGALTFASPISIAGGNPPVELFDFNGDGRLDLLAGSDLYLAEGANFAFSDARSVPLQRSNHTRFLRTIANNGSSLWAFSNDGQGPCACAGTGTGAIEYRSPLGGMSFNSNLDVGCLGFCNGGFNAFAVAVGDIDGDGDQDWVSAGGEYVICGCGGWGTRLAVNNGDGTWSIGNSLCGADLRGAIGIGAVSSSGLRDFIGITPGNELRAVDLQTDPQTCTGLIIDQSVQGRVLIADFTLNGLDDVVVLDANGLRLYPQISPSFFGPSLPLGASPAENELVMDVDEDGLPDVLLASLTSAGGILYHRNLGAGSFAPAAPIDLAPASRIAVGDLNGDGRDDLAALDNGGLGIRWLRNAGAGVFDPPRTVVVTTSPVDEIAIGDFNRDGAADIATLSRSSWDVSVLLNRMVDCNGNGIPDSDDLANGSAIDCNDNGIPDSCDLTRGFSTDCNGNGIPDECDLLSGVEPDCNGNGIPDSCEVNLGLEFDCNANGILDSCELASGAATDCNGNGVLDSCEIGAGTAFDCNGNGVLDQCDLNSGTSLDCNGNGVPDECDVAFATSLDCNLNGIPDECDISSGFSLDCNSNSIPDDCEIGAGQAQDCNGNGIPDSCEIASGAETDCNGNDVPDSCELASGTAADCNANGTLDECDLAGGASQDCNGNGVPDECELAGGAEADCNGNGVLDSCELAAGTAFDCNSNGTLDSCDLAAGTEVDCDANGVPDSCDLVNGAPDCNGNGILDSCEIALGTSQDCNANGIIDACEIAAGTESDCNGNGVLDSCEIASGASLDCNGNGVPDLCEVFSGNATDCNGNFLLDSCELSADPTKDCNGNGVLDECEINTGSAADCNANGIPDTCELWTTPAFAPAAEIPISSSSAPWFVCQTDFEPDGDLDLVVCNRAAGELAGYRNDGTGQFGPAEVLANAATGVFSIAAGDLDGDGDDDLIHANSAADSLSLLINNNGSFLPSQDIATGVDGARSVRLEDVDSDGHLDVVAGSFNDDTVAWYRNNGAGVFGPRVVITTNADFVVCIDLADMDGDGDPDVVAACEQGGQLLLLENQGAGQAWTETVVTAIDGPNFVRLGDLDGDSHVDIAFTTAALDSIGWVRNLGVPSQFAAPITLSGSFRRASSVELADLDLDGDLDLAATAYGDPPSQGSAPTGRLAWFENSGVGSFLAGRDVATGLNRAAHAIPADLDSDGIPDLATVCWAGNILLTHRNLRFTPQVPDCNANGVPDSCDIASGMADCDQDGILDNCQIAADPTLDLDLNGTLDACDAIGLTYCSPAVPNSNGVPGVLTVLGNQILFLNNVQLTARQLPTGSFGFFITSLTQGFTPNVPNSQGALCVQGSVGRFVGPGQILSSGTTGSLFLPINLNSHPTPTGLISVQLGDTWNYQLWYRDAVGGQTTSNFTDAVAVTFQ